MVLNQCQAIFQLHGALMTTLHEVQHEYGYIPWEAMVEIAKVLGITPAQVADVVSFYEDYSSEPLGNMLLAFVSRLLVKFVDIKRSLTILKTG